MSNGLKSISVPPLEEHSATIIFLHGSGDCGEGIKERLDELAPYGQKRFQFPHIKIIYPTAPTRRYTLMYGMQVPVWFDRREMALDGWEDEAGTNEICERLDQLINDEVTRCGIQPHRILIGGLSMGGAMSLQYGLGWRGRTKPLISQCSAGIFVLSSFLHKTSKVYKTLKQESGSGRHYPVIYQSHGALDDLVPLEWGVQTNQNLAQLGIQCVSAATSSSSAAAAACSSSSSGNNSAAAASCSNSSAATYSSQASGSSSSSAVVFSNGLHIYPDLEHTISVEELKHLSDWILTVLPRNQVVKL